MACEQLCELSQAPLPLSPLFRFSLRAYFAMSLCTYRSPIPVRSATSLGLALRSSSIAAAVIRLPPYAAYLSAGPFAEPRLDVCWRKPELAADTGHVTLPRHDHAVALELIGVAGPLYATSAKVSDEPDTLAADEVLIAFATKQDGLAAVVDGGPVPGGVARGGLTENRQRLRIA